MGKSKNAKGSQRITGLSRGQKHMCSSELLASLWTGLGFGQGLWAHNLVQSNHTEERVSRKAEGTSPRPLGNCWEKSCQMEAEVLDISTSL